MKKIIALSLVALLGAVSQSSLAAEEKKVCIPVKDKEGKPVNDPKTGKPKEDCKMVKVHKKLEGTEVPGQKK